MANTARHRPSCMRLCGTCLMPMLLPLVVLVLFRSVTAQSHSLTPEESALHVTRLEAQVQELKLKLARCDVEDPGQRKGNKMASVNRRRANLREGDSQCLVFLTSALGDVFLKCVRRLFCGMSQRSPMHLLIALASHDCIQSSVTKQSLPLKLLVCSSTH